MIGAASAASPGALPSSAPMPPAPAGVAADAASTPTATAADSPSAASGNTGAPGAATAAGPQDNDARQRTAATKQAGKASDFAALLARSGEAVPAPALAAATKDMGDEPDIDSPAETGVATASASLPDQLLALLGAWATPPAATADAPALQAAAIPTAAVATSSIATGKPAPPALPAPVMPVPSGFNAMSTGVSNAQVAIDPAVGSSVDATPSSPPAETSASLPAFPNIAPAPPAAPEARPALAAPVNMPTDPQQGFDDGFGARLVWMAEQRLGHAEIRVNPQHLGPIEVRVQVDGTQVNAEFSSAHASVRQTIEASMPRLRELLGQQGLQLNHADVGQRQAGSGQRPREDTERARGSEPSMDAAAVGRPLRSRGLLDEYA